MPTAPLDISLDPVAKQVDFHSEEAPVIADAIAQTREVEVDRRERMKQLASVCIEMFKAQQVTRVTMHNCTLSYNAGLHKPQPNPRAD